MLSFIPLIFSHIAKRQNQLVYGVYGCRFTDLTGTDYSEGAIDLARSLADRDGFSSLKFLVRQPFEAQM